MTTDPIHDIKSGLEVYTIDGERIGTVKEVDEDMFHVDAALQPDYWLSRTMVQSFTAELVTLKFDKTHIGDYKLEGPRCTGDSRHSRPRARFGCGRRLTIPPPTNATDVASLLSGKHR